MSKKIIITIVIIITLSAIGFFLYTKFIKPKPESEDENKNSSSGSGNSGTGSSEFPLKSGSKGMKVKQLQAGLNLLKKTKLDVDGKFGPKTLAALKKHFNISQVSQYDYDQYILPYLSQINAELNRLGVAFSGSEHGKTAYSATDTEIFAAAPVYGIGDFLQIGEIKGYEVNKDDARPVESGELLGTVIQAQESFYLINRPDETLAFTLKSQTNLL